jgi:hypothetical protein
VALVLAFACIAVLLPGNLTSEGGAAGNPEFRQAEQIEFSSFPFNPRLNFSDLVIVRSARYTVDQPPFQAFVANLSREGEATRRSTTPRSTTRHATGRSSRATGTHS